MTSRWAQRIAGDRPQFGMWLASGSGYIAEICAGSGIDWLLVDQEHAPNDIHSTLAQMQVLAGYPDVDVVVRPPVASGSSRLMGLRHCGHPDQQQRDDERGYPAHCGTSGPGVGRAGASGTLPPLRGRGLNRPRG